MSAMHGHHDMGHTVAGWTGSAIALSGFTIAGVAMCAGSVPGIGLGTVLVAAGAVTTWLLHLAGWGKPSGPRPEAQWDWRVRDTMAGHADCLGCRLAGRGRRAGAPGRAGATDAAGAAGLAEPVKTA
ncbi:HGxxPAAW family protein [Kitasatospora sp. NPDC088346]|uniref:HGxxPAAW family protein n=1 Tax=Kitasatospora sp. NPDC088346 TaxID=3364073 RepID=UPI003816A121